MAKRKYRAVQVKDANVTQLVESLGDGRCVVAIDVAKENFFAAVMDAGQQVLVTVKWKHPGQSPDFMRLVAQLAADRSLDVAMEPSGVYGDAIRSFESARRSRTTWRKSTMGFPAGMMRSRLPSSASCILMAPASVGLSRQSTRGG